LLRSPRWGVFLSANHGITREGEINMEHTFTSQVDNEDIERNKIAYPKMKERKNFLGIMRGEKVIEG